MVYQTGKMILQVTQELYRGKVNDVVVCQDLSASMLTYYTLLIIKDNSVAKNFLKAYEETAPNVSKDAIVKYFTWENNYIIVFGYEKERSVEKFFSSDIRTLSDCEQLCMRIVVECMSGGIPFPILYLQLTQDQINMRQDKSVHMGYCLNLDELDLEIEEKDCVLVAARLLFRLLDHVGNLKTASYKLLAMKNEHGEYKKFVELYRDLEAASVPVEKEGYKERGKKLLSKYKDVLFRILLVVCVIAAAVALVMLISQLIFGDIPFLRFFVNTFKQIGTESLMQ